MKHANGDSALLMELLMNASKVWNQIRATRKRDAMWSKGYCDAMADAAVRDLIDKCMCRQLLVNYF